MSAFKRPSVLSFFGALVSPAALAAEGGVPHPIDLYGTVLHGFHLGHEWVPTLGALVSTFILTLIGLQYRAQVQAAMKKDPVPSGRFSIGFLIDSIMNVVYSIAKDNGGHHYRRYLPLLAACFLFILVSNLTGLIPGFPPPTVSMDTNVAVGLVVFLWYNWAGAKENGWGYLKHFAGPVAFIAPFFFCIELVSHASRPLSLGLRLMGNIYGDHTLLAVFTSISYLVFPALLTFFGLLVAVVQSFVFTLLSGIYLSMAISHDH